MLSHLAVVIESKVMPEDSKLRQYLFTAVVGICITMGGCFAKGFSTKVEALDNRINTIERNDARTDQDIKDFRQSFEEFKQDVKDDIRKHHR